MTSRRQLPRLGTGGESAMRGVGSGSDARDRSIGRSDQGLRKPRARRARRGLGLVDSMLALAVLAIAGSWMAQSAAMRAERVSIGAEARELAALAHAAARFQAATPPGWTPGTQLTEIPVDDLIDGGFRSPHRPQSTPGRQRVMTVWAWRESPSAPTLVLARARDWNPTRPPPRALPSVESGANGVGGILLAMGDLVARGPGVHFDLAPLEAVSEDFAEPGDLFAFAAPASAETCGPYLYRAPVQGCPDATVMGTDLDMGGFEIRDVGQVRANELQVQTVRGSLVVPGDLDVAGSLRVEGRASVTSLTAPRAEVDRLEATTLTGNRPFRVNELRVDDLFLRGRCFGC